MSQFRITEPLIVTPGTIEQERQRHASRTVAKKMRVSEFIGEAETRLSQSCQEDESLHIQAFVQVMEVLMKRRTLFGRPLGISLIMLQKTLWGSVMLVVAVVLLTFHAQHVTNPLQQLFTGELAEDPHDLLATTLIRLVPFVSLQTELLLAVGVTVYALLEGIEVWGLWYDLMWVELLIVVETAAFLPYDVWELVHHLSVVKVLSLVINILIVWYLLARYLRKRAVHREQHERVRQPPGVRRGPRS